MLCPPELRAMWRRGRDSNPGQSFWPCNRLAGGCLRPTRPPLQASSPRSIRGRSGGSEPVPQERETDLVCERARRRKKIGAADDITLTARKHREPEVARDEERTHPQSLRLLERLAEMFVRLIVCARTNRDVRRPENLERARVIALFLVLHRQVECALRRLDRRRRLTVE